MAGNARYQKTRTLSLLTSIRESFLPIHGSKLFNSLPRSLCNVSAVSVDSDSDSVDSSLDAFLHSIPDEPQIRGYTAMRRATSNSIIQMSEFGAPAFQVTNNNGRMLERSP